jgi:hypothetical protein
MHSAQKIKTSLSLCPWRAQTILLVGQLEAGGRPGDLLSARWHCYFMVPLFSVHGRLLELSQTTAWRQLLSQNAYISTMGVRTEKKSIVKVLTGCFK